MVEPKRLACQMHLKAEEAAALGRLDQVPAADALLAALPRHAGDVLLRTVQHWARLLRARDAARLAAALEARVLGDSHVSVLRHQLPVDAATCEPRHLTSSRGTENHANLL
jgi:hypothetical protein